MLHVTVLNLSLGGPSLFLYINVIGSSSSDVDRGVPVKRWDKGYWNLAT